MIRHVVFFTIPDAKNREAARAGLEMLKGIPDADILEVGENLATDPIAGTTPDLIVYGEFESEEQLARYKAHPLYQRAIEVVRPLREMRIAADFTAD